MTEDRELPDKAAFSYPVPFFGGLEQLLQIQKATLEMYARQTTAGINMIQQLFPMIPAACVNAAEKAVVDLLRVQTGTLDFIGSRIGDPARADMMKFPDILQDSADQCLAIHRKLVDVFVQQMQCFSAAFRWPNEISRRDQ